MAGRKILSQLKVLEKLDTPKRNVELSRELFGIPADDREDNNNRNKVSNILKVMIKKELVKKIVAIGSTKKTKYIRNEEKYQLMKQLGEI